MPFPTHRCPACGYAVFEQEPCAVCLNPRLFFGCCAHDVPMNQECPACDAAILRSQVAGALDPQKAFYQVMCMYRESVPYHYAGVVSECFEMLRRRLDRAESKLSEIEKRAWSQTESKKHFGMLSIEGV